MGCSLATSLVDRIKSIMHAHHPDWMIVEPSEMVVTKELRDVAAMGLRDAQYDVGPLIVLVDGPDFDFNWNERHRLVQGQMDDADIVIISRVDLIDKKNREAITQTLVPHGNPLYPLSAQSYSDMECLYQMVTRFE